MLELEPDNLRPRSMPELLDAGVALYRASFLHFLAVAAITQLPLGLINVTIGAALFNGQLPTFSNTAVTADTLDSAAVAVAILAALALGVLGIVLGSFGLAAMIYSVRARLSDEKPGAREVYTRALPRVPALLGARLLFTLALAGALLPAALLFGVGAYLASLSDSAGVGAGVIGVIAGVLLFGVGGILLIFLWVLWRFHSQAAVLESRGPLAALRRSREVLRGRWWRTVAFVILINMLVGALALSPSALVQLPLALVYGPFAQFEFWPALITNSVSVLTEILLLPVEVITFTLLYYDYRVRGEALDIELALRRLREGARP